MATQKAEENKQYDYDQYGFYLPIERIQIENKQKELKKINARVEKWRKMLPNLTHLIKIQDKKLKERIRKGIPDGIRLKVWPVLAQIDQTKEAYSTKQFQQLIQEQDFPYQVDIAADLKRTFPNNQLFQNHNKTGLEALNNILKAVSLTHADMGYCQGLNFIAAAFMIYVNDEESYHIINSMLINYDCMKMFLDVGSIRKQLFVHDQLVKKFLPEVAEVLQKNCVESIFFATGWYMTLFSSVLPFQYFLRVMDIFFNEKWKIVYRVALAILKLKKKEILQCKSMESFAGKIKLKLSFEKLIGTNK
ncbi:plant adhesion molecule 1, putative [Ichthyophthirius multifiliis]|uniref:Plant adhesion molecule 1, putative n=1 Tax=Ichthyophthirius multifiliis TaxID=5932 RepID=G0QWS0_ICHMU|nr:plant adhesion molecule 1, putative [Ichthyophthirius multifiliis]EGR30341.1 plant adhesion molecule 1, putative [Ichthyophthirius multifiliis]|eukprot:XP_004031928.1 plant adhesion molecule 1, putative [Ichthyophthirius multifiliis]